MEGDDLSSLKWLDKIQSRPTDEEIRAFVVPKFTPAELRKNSFDVDPTRADLLTRLKTATPQQIKAYVDANVANIDDARALLKRILLVLAQM